jgi:hypothetical protein
MYKFSKGKKHVYVNTYTQRLTATFCCERELCVFPIGQYTNLAGVLSDILDTYGYDTILSYEGMSYLHTSVPCTDSINRLLTAEEA